MQQAAATLAFVLIWNAAAALPTPYPKASAEIVVLADALRAPL